MSASLCLFALAHTHTLSLIHLNHTQHNTRFLNGCLSVCQATNNTASCGCIFAAILLHAITNPNLLSNADLSACPLLKDISAVSLQTPPSPTQQNHIAQFRQLSQSCKTTGQPSSSPNSQSLLAARICEAALRVALSSQTPQASSLFWLLIASFLRLFITLLVIGCSTPLLYLVYDAAKSYWSKKPANEIWRDTKKQVEEWRSVVVDVYRGKVDLKQRLYEILAEKRQYLRQKWRRTVIGARKLLARLMANDIQPQHGVKPSRSAPSLLAILSPSRYVFII